MKTALPNVSATSVDQPFLDSFAAGLVSRFGTPHAVGLSKITIILPHESARVGLMEALTKQAPVSALLLPRVYVLNDNLPSRNQREDSDLNGLIPYRNFPSRTPIHTTARKLILATLIQQWQKSAHESNLQSFSESLKTASSLAEFVDELHAANIDYAYLNNLSSREDTADWAGINKFLTILSKQWPVILDEKSLEDPLVYDSQIARALTEHWKKHPPKNQVIAAGFIGNLPHVVDLLAAISWLTMGHVVIPSLDRDLQKNYWVNLPEEHAQFSLKRLLELLQVEYQSVPKWFDRHHSPHPPQRQQFLRTAIWPLNKSHTPKPSLNISKKGLAGLVQVTCHDTSQEAKVVALIIKNFLDKEEGNVALITSDNQLLKQVSTELRRWQLIIRQPLQQNIRETRAATFLQLIANMICLDATPVSLLSVLKHPMCKGNRASKLFPEIVKDLEVRCLRGIRPEPGFSGIIASLNVVSQRDKRLLQWLEEINMASRRFCSLIPGHGIPLRELLNTHLDFSTWLGQDGTGDLSKDTTPWLETDDKALYKQLISLSSHLDESLVVDGKEYAEIFETLFSNMTITEKNIKDSRIHTISPDKSLFHSADLNILAGMNKDLWPPTHNARSWMNTAIRRSIGLPSIELLTGISNFDFHHNFSASQVVLTRSTRRNGVETKPSDHFTRLKNILEKADLYDFVDGSTYWNGLAQSLNYFPPSPVKIHRPAPRPPRFSRPRSLSATQIELWLRDPYSIFASTILGLRKLRPVDARLQPADYGRMVHTALENFIGAYSTTLPTNALQELLKVGRKAFMPARSRPEVFSFWWSRFERSASYFIEEEKKTRPYHTFSHAEVPGSFSINLPGGEFSLTAKADRINLRKDGSVDIVDYKTGSRSSSRQILAGNKPQLLIEAIIALHGDYKNINTHAVNSLVSLRLTGSSPAGQYQSFDEAIPFRAEELLSKLRELISAFDDEETPYYFLPNNDFASPHNDFQHLARMNEWLIGPGIVKTTL